MELSSDSFRAKLKETVDWCVSNHQPVKVKRKNGESFFVIGEEDWNSIEETLYLNRLPGMVKSIQKSSQEPLSKGTKLKDLKW
ncbi:MAG: type II toxin-antitoxin system Phd/YefM family antitoxin [Deltaproteobacteria bacterium]|nr:type II toxin-antitoxin system Phd/YefM family antitoxin [Deltaproteobacteria bacterium]